MFYYNARPTLVDKEAVLHPLRNLVDQIIQPAIGFCRVRKSADKPLCPTLSARTKLHSMQNGRLERLGKDAVHADIVFALGRKRLEEGKVGPAGDLAGEDCDKRRQQEPARRRDADPLGCL